MMSLLPLIAAWDARALAAVCGMSRSAFANGFRDVIGLTPGSYLQRWRVGLAQKALLAGKSLKLIAQDVGYGSEAALSRAFKAQSGKGPREWRKEYRQRLRITDVPAGRAGRHRHHELLQLSRR